MSSPIKAVVSDFGGVLTTPLIDAFASVQKQSGIDGETLGKALARATGEDGLNPLYELETGRMSEPDFIARLERALAVELGRETRLHEFSDVYWAGLHPNDAMIGLMIRLRHLGFRMALLTNNVKEWEPRWRAMMPVDEIFEAVVDSAFVGMRKPDPEIYAITLRRLELPGEACLFVDDIDVNCAAAEAAGMHAVHFRDTAQATAEIEAALGLAGA